MTGVSALHARGLDGGGVTVCIVDTGVDPSHPDLARVPILAWRDFIRHRAAPYDDDGHGTAMAGLIAARGAFRGVAPGVSLIVVKALDSRGMGTSAGIAAAVDFCGDPNADGDPSDGAGVVSLSLAASTNLTAGAGTDVATSVNAALARGIIVIASAGNDGLADDGDVQSPASIPGVIAVGAVERFGVLARFSSMGTVAGRSDPDRKPEIVAPGVDLVTTARGGGYRLVTGTSASAAFVAGAVALLLQAHHGTTGPRTAALIPSLKTAIMNAAAKEVGQVLPHDPHYGYGILDVSGVVDASW
jgi:serine protease AprX